ncbi:MAG: hypothetical protein H2172_15765 [Opitutus sp.]|nr:hypothetical protein [Opitutus sp.]MCS6246756.1 hypothetical protein [Opitutus sp.]MCS6273282.1 hypothetical protein [Opitutus sp.]MCS6276180.1 hypothetical protein [Opitutus sp.]MCS6301274.1 hypothetical protein [Opitutus sp.]
MTSTITDHTDPIVESTAPSAAIFAGRQAIVEAKQREAATRTAHFRTQAEVSQLADQIEADRLADLERRVEAEIAGLTAPAANIGLERKLAALATAVEVASRVSAAWEKARNDIPQASNSLMRAILEEHAAQDLPQLENALERALGGLADLTKMAGADQHHLWGALAPMLAMTATGHSSARDAARISAEASEAQVIVLIDRQREARAAAGWPSFAQIEARAKAAAEALRTV